MGPKNRQSFFKKRSLTHDVLPPHSQTTVLRNSHVHLTADATSNSIGNTSCILQPTTITNYNNSYNRPITMSNPSNSQEYCTIEDINKVFNSNTSSNNSLIIMHINIRSVQKNLKKLHQVFLFI